MRTFVITGAFVIIGALAGCISEPTGLDQSWPPKLGLTVESVASADLDGDNSTELLVAGSGGEHRAGIYRIEGDVDVMSGTVSSFSTYVPLPFDHPSSIAIANGEVYASSGFETQTIGLHALSTTQLAVQPGAPIDTEMPTGNALLWVRPATFPNSVPRVVVSNGTEIHHFTADGNDPQVVNPPPGMTAWSGAQVLVTYADTHVAVATSTQVWEGTITNGAIAFIDPPIEHAAWLGQTAIDLDNDHRAELVGYDPTTHSVCVLDLATTTPRCVATMGTYEGPTVGIAMITDSAPPGLTLVVTVSSGGKTEVSVLTTVIYSSTMFTGNAFQPTVVPIDNGRIAVASRNQGTAQSVLTVGDDGTIRCVWGAC